MECPRSDTEMFIEVFGIYFDENGKEISGEYPRFSIYQSQMPESLVDAMMNANMELALYLKNHGWENGDIETVL
ncbi:MAG: hypothetical protein K2X01_12005 [Cyanobacteria bacterium]|nr:hypothetical protein [Cyanobacteriota bacterium]